MLKSASPEKLSQRLQLVGESKTMRFFNIVQQMRCQGHQIINLAVGEPNFNTPEPVITATQDALNAQQTRYSATAGIDALRTRLAEEFKGFTTDNIILSNGAKQALFSLFQVLCDLGDEVIIPKPCWVSFTEQVKLAGGQPVLVTSSGQGIDPQAIRDAVTPRTRAILINSPNNPTGAVYDRQTLTAIAEIATTHGFHLIADEAYHYFVYDGLEHVPLFDVVANPDQVITVRSFSKHYNMTGYRIGYVAASTKVIQAMTKFQGHCSGNVCTFAQYGALAALEMDQTIIEERRIALQRKRDIAYEQSMPLFDCNKPQGAFYLFPDVTRHLKPGESSEDLALRLLEKAGVAVVPGKAFSGPGHVRISFGADETELYKGFEKIKEVL